MSALVRLVTTLILWATFAAYLFVRRYGGPGAQKLGAGLSLFGAVNVPIVYLSVFFWNNLHPKATVVAKRPDGTPVGEAEEAFVVQPSAAELLQPAPRPEVLRAVADATRGRVLDAGDRLDSLPWRDPERVEVGQRKSRPLWDRWGVLVALCCIVGAEWTLRRRWGYA